MGRRGEGRRDKTGVSPASLLLGGMDAPLLIIVCFLSVFIIIIIMTTIH